MVHPRGSAPPCKHCGDNHWHYVSSTQLDLGASPTLHTPRGKEWACTGTLMPCRCLASRHRTLPSTTTGAPEWIRPRIGLHVDQHPTCTRGRRRYPGLGDCENGCSSANSSITASSSFTLQSTRCSMDWHPHPPAMAAMVAMQRRMPSEAGWAGGPGSLPFSEG